MDRKRDSMRVPTIAVAMALLASLLFAGHAAARPFQTGLQDLTAYDSGDALPFQRTKGAGAKYVRITLYWPRIAPQSRPSPGPLDPAWDPTDPGSPYYQGWGFYDQQIRQAAAQGLEVILDVSQTPSWAAAPGCSGDATCTPVPSDYTAFSTAVARRYSGTFNPGSGTLPHVRYYQAENEPNLNFFYKPVFQNGHPVSPDTYRVLLNGFYGAVHGVNNSNQVLSAGLAPLARPGATIGPLDFMRRLLCMAGRKHPHPKAGCKQKAKLDIWTTHPYTTGGPTHSAPGPDDVSLGDLRQMTALLRAADKAGKIQNSSKKTPFWVTEISWDSKPPDNGGLPLAIHARWLAESFYRMYKAGVSVAVWFELRDEAKGTRPDAELYQSGLYFRAANIADDKPKPALEAFRFPFVALKTKHGFLFWGRTPTSRRASVRIELKGPKGGYKRVKVAKAAGSGIFQGTVKTDTTKGFVRAKAPTGTTVGTETSVPFSLKYVKDFYQPPFGGKRTAGRLTPRRH
jgi:hypothetical protein